MSKNKKKKYTKHRIQGRANPYGLCPCGPCRKGRAIRKVGMVEKIKHKQRTAWKTNKQEKRGAYTD